ncbi:MAG: hypothetical protein FWH35_06820 [Treponema sp.]|nr:hypothetical protein [Treponema sp.]
MVSLAAVFLSFFSLFYFKSYLKRRTGQERILSELRAEVNQILKSINETTERDISLIEDREKNLKNLLSDIDRRFNVYVREMEKIEENNKAHAALTSPPLNPEISYNDLGKRRFRIQSQMYPKTDEPENVVNNETNDPLNSAFPIPEFKVKQEQNSAPDSSTLSSKPGKFNSQIYDLLKAGLAPHIIASRLGISIAEVEFASALLERRADKL